MMSGPTAGFAVIGVSASAVACVGLGLSAALRLFGGFAWAPIMEAGTGASRGAGASGPASTLWLSVWNIALPSVVFAITLITFYKWRSRENATEY
jgi:hypothetical protein